MERDAKLLCPHQTCGHLNAWDKTECEACGADLRTFARLYLIPALLYNQGLQAYHEGATEKALRYLHLSSELNPRDVQPLLVLGKLYAQQEKLELAMDVWLDALEVDPSNKTAMTCLYEAKKLLTAKRTKASKPKRRGDKKSKSRRRASRVTARK
ncbi:MAG: hypothetical protein ACE5IY_16960 [bacterium]